MNVAFGVLNSYVLYSFCHLCECHFSCLFWQKKLLLFNLYHGELIVAPWTETGGLCERCDVDSSSVMRRGVQRSSRETGLAV